MAKKLEVKPRKKAPFKFGFAVRRIGGCFQGDFVELTELSANERVLFGKFLSGPKEGAEFSCPVGAVKEVTYHEEGGKKVPSMPKAVRLNASE